MWHAWLEHRFFEHRPETLKPGILYIWMSEATATHLCDCGEEMVTPSTPTDCSMTMEGNGILLDPLAGSRQQPCRSHYVLKCDRVIKVGP